MLTGWLTAIAEVFKTLNVLLPRLFSLLDFILSYYQARAKREADAEKASIDAQLLAQETQARREQSNLKAFLYGLEELWKDKYQDILGWLKSHQEDLILRGLSDSDTTAVNSIMFDTNSSAEYKAAQIVRILRAKEMALLPK